MGGIPALGLMPLVPLLAHAKIWRVADRSKLSPYATQTEPRKENALGRIALMALVAHANQRNREPTEPFRLWLIHLLLIKKRSDSQVQHQILQRQKGCPLSC